MVSIKHGSGKTTNDKYLGNLTNNYIRLLCLVITTYLDRNFHSQFVLFVKTTPSWLISYYCQSYVCVQYFRNYATARMLLTFFSSTFLSFLANDTKLIQLKTSLSILWLIFCRTIWCCQGSRPHRPKVRWRPRGQGFLQTQPPKNN